MPHATRRQFLAGLLGAGAAAGLPACGPRGPEATARPTGTPVPVPSGGPTGPARDLALRARPVEVDLGGRIARTWAYGDSVPGEPIRATVGERLRIAVTNELPVDTSLHWHGLAIRNDMDGVPGITTPPISAGGTFTYDFVVPTSGTHWFHPHTGLQLDTGLYAPLIVEDPADPGDHDLEWIVVLDDWTDGVGQSPEEILAELSGSGGMMRGGHGHRGSGYGGDVAHPLHLVNGRVAQDPETLAARPGDRVRIRLVNAGADTVYRVALAEHPLTVTHSDGFPVVPIEGDCLVIGMGERYDVQVTLGDGAFPLVAEPIDKAGLARAVIRTGSGRVPGPDHTPDELGGREVTVRDLAVLPGSALPVREPDTVQDVVLGGGMHDYVWTINGRTHDEMIPLTVAPGQLSRLVITNRTMMAHPVHVHGHTFQVGPAGGRGARKDTVLLAPMTRVEVDLAADNPGVWMVHCHNAYHAEAGMMTHLEYRA